MLTANAVLATASLTEGESAPDFTLPGTDGEVILSRLKGKNVVLYFYPKDDTPGCTIEAKEFSAMKEQFADANTIVIGISKDSVTSHQKFCTKYSLGIPLISDESGEVTEAYGVWVEKSMYGKSYMGIERATFLIDKQGRLAKVWRKVKVDGHVDEVLAAAKATH